MNETKSATVKADKAKVDKALIIVTGTKKRTVFRDSLPSDR